MCMLLDFGMKYKWTMPTNSADGTIFSMSDVDISGCYFVDYCRSFLNSVTISTSVLEDWDTISYEGCKKSAPESVRLFFPSSFICCLRQARYFSGNIFALHPTVNQVAPLNFELVTWCPTFQDFPQYFHTYSGNCLWQFPKICDVYPPTM
jgi:hypothetical protein